MRPELHSSHVIEINATVRKHWLQKYKVKIMKENAVALISPEQLY